MARRRFMVSFSRALVIVGAVGTRLPLQPAVAQTPGTDPVLLRSMGFAADAKNVYMDVGQATSSNADAVTSATPPPTGTDFSAISAKEFIGRQDQTGTDWRYNGGSNSLGLVRL